MTRYFLNRLFSMAMLSLLALAVPGCATKPNATRGDPLESFNRSMFKFNDDVDRAVLRPVATAYKDVTPALVRTGVNNFFSNIADVWSFGNNVLQLKPKESIDMLMRIGVNSVFGLGGVLDIASEMKIERHPEDFGLTLGYWGVGSGAYLVLPLLGSSTVRDGLGSLVDTQVDAVMHTSNVLQRNSLIVLRGIDIRSNYLGAGNVLDQAALDKYTFAREVYLQRRRSLILPDKEEKEERFDLPESPANKPAKTSTLPVSNAAPDTEPTPLAK